ncbi:MAG: aminotransferase class I/II-fold pyridoxal phosphate-dependent enzyme [Synechococcales bacterium]|nr:aminotransferase class I/II-fold pyridoxal phosphate-dependent enzyme [Synechococcales bacterium]
MHHSHQQSETPLLTALQTCAARDHAPFHTPGHKRGQGLDDRLRNLLHQAFLADLPELPELDNLFTPTGVIQQAQILAAEAFGAEQTWFLANGSTSGVIAAILATCQPGDKVILPRNVHRSAISGLILAGVNPIFLLPAYDAASDLAHGVDATTIARALQQHPDTKAILLVSPTYYGVCSDIASIYQITHQYDIPLIVDEAHGSHFGFHPNLPASALSLGADIVIQSTHKTLSGLTQAAMLHCQGHRIDRDRITQALQLVQSTSPNYLLLASLDAARWQIVHHGHSLLDHALNLADRARSTLLGIPGISLLQRPESAQSGFHNLDPLRLTITVSSLGLTGWQADEMLTETFGVTCELPTLHHVTFIITHGNTETEIDRLVEAVKTLAQQQQNYIAQPPSPQFQDRMEYETVIAPRDAFFAASQPVAIADAIGQVSAELICPYPPGIPLLMPGERITPAAIAVLQQVLAIGGCITGNQDPTLQSIRIVVNQSHQSI